MLKTLYISCMGHREIKLELSEKFPFSRLLLLVPEVIWRQVWYEVMGLTQLFFRHAKMLTFRAGYAH